MDLSSINNLKQAKRADDVTFQGRAKIKNENGGRKDCFFLPYINLKDGEKIGIEFIILKKDGIEYTIPDNAKPVRYKSNSKEFQDFENGRSTGIEIDTTNLQTAGEYGYRFAVYDKDGKRLRTFTDNAGTQVSSPAKDGDYTIVSTKQGTPATEGSMMHIFQDSYNIKGKKDFRRNHINKAGGTINGIIEKIDEDEELKPYKYIMTTPLIGGGAVSSHMYHPANHFKVSEGTGTKEDFMNLQVACFNKGKGYVLDGAFTSQGYEGVQLNHAIKHKDSPFKYWFKNPGEDGYALGVLSDDKEADKYTGIRVVNPKNSYDYEYDPNMPTYIQFYDTRLASEEQVRDRSKLIKEYAKTNTDDPYEITTWHDGTLCNYFEVDPNSPSLQGRTEGTLEEWEKDGSLNAILNPAGNAYSFVRRGKVSGTTGWDGNIDLVKMNLSNQVVNNPKLVKGSKQARNQMFNVARYWTDETRKALIMDIAKNVHGKSDAERRQYFKGIEKNFSLEDGTLENIFKNIQNEQADSKKAYDCKIADDKRDGNTIIQEEILNFPLESLPFSPELLGILSTPYLTVRPSENDKADASKIELFEN